MANIHSKEYEINYYDVDYNLRCKLSSIVNFFCDIGNVQSESLGDTIEGLTERNMAWVFYKYDINIIEYPKYRDVIKVETMPAAFNKFYAHRKYRVFNKKGTLLAEGLALFFLIDTKKRRPIRISQETIDLYDAKEISGINIKMDEILNLEKQDVLKNFIIRYSDIDSNGHVNNVKYMEWAIESVPIEVIKDYKLKRIKVGFEKEITYGHSVDVSTEIIKEDNDNIITVHLIKSDEGKELTKLEIKWIRE